MQNSASNIRRLFSLLGLFALSVLIVHCSSDTDPDQSQTNKDTAQKAAEDVPELADAMGQLQTYTHKYALAVDAEYHELAEFYFHEVRASTDHIKENIPGYEGYDIERFMTMFLDPTIEPVQTALDNRDWDEVRQRTIEMVDACNDCHNATSHGFVRVTPGFDNNPFNQDFSAPDE